MIYRALKDKKREGETVAKAGDLLFERRGGGLRSTLVVGPRGDGYGPAWEAEIGETERAGEFVWRDFPELLEYYLSGRSFLPNLEVMDVDAGLNAIAAGGGLVARPGVSNLLLLGQDRSTWGRAFLGRTQGGNLDGSGYVIIYHSSPKSDLPRVARFKICDHAFVSGPNANPSRGWHPGRCSKCGLDMTVDSGD